MPASRLRNRVLGVVALALAALVPSRPAPAQEDAAAAAADGAGAKTVKLPAPVDSVTPAGSGHWHPHPQYPIYAAASADGLTFAGWTRGLSPSGVRIMQIRGDDLAERYEHDSAGALLPSWDGSLLFTGTGIYSADLKPIAADQFRGQTCVPAYQPSYFLSIGTRRDEARGGGNGAAKAGVSLSVYTTGDRTLLVTLDDFPELGSAQDGGSGNGETLGWHERVFLAPQHQRIVTVSTERTALVARPFDMVEALDKAGIDYLFVESLPVSTAEPGAPYAYPIKVKSKRGGVTFTLDSAPEGMTLSADGVLAWDVPTDRAPGAEGIIITVEDASGQSVFHTFNPQTAPAGSAAQRAKPETSDKP